MASAAAAVTMAMASPSVTHRRALVGGSGASFHPLRTSPGAGAGAVAVRSARRSLAVHASSRSVKEQAVAGLTAAAVAAAAVAAALIIPDVAEAAQPGLSPSLKNFLLSIVSGGVVLTAIVGAVVGVSNFDPVKRS